MNRWVLAGLLLVSAACGSGNEHPELIGDFQTANDGCQADAGGDCSVQGAASQPAAASHECMSEQQASEYDDPLTSVVEAFETDSFYPQNTKPVTGEVLLRTLGRLPRTWACTTTEAGAPFELYGGDEDGEGGGLRIDPVDHEEFYPTMLQKIQRAGRSYSVVPVVGKDELDGIFADLDVARDPEKGQILVEFAIVTSLGERHRVDGIRLQSGGAGAVAYRDRDTWSTEVDRTTVDGLALLVNVNSADDFGLRIDAHYEDVDTPDATAQPLEDLYSITGGITYLAVTPEQQ